MNCENQDVNNNNFKLKNKSFFEKLQVPYSNAVTIKNSV